MEAEKRKREDDGKEEGVLKGGQQEVEEEEVEEFFAILRRIQVAVKYFEKSEGKKWRPLLEREDFKELDGADLDTEKKEGNSFYENSGLDLNLDPNPNE
ncbi:PROTEIN NIM1-INTERACTING 2 [Salix purpurea]|uniref:PROTEIN NIM1-INTERACTING 2 n=2 Tax=Salix TaxID=40685 RepID=A0A9Q0Z2C0_SALPP|nr:hypothetical protein OIU84_019186 [Salix udensis]KAJ6718751.1 PROTEIN NIM1-INTERACTING 2 [Salix purpurea]